MIDMKVLSIISSDQNGVSYGYVVRPKNGYRRSIAENIKHVYFPSLNPLHV